MRGAVTLAQEGFFDIEPSVRIRESFHHGALVGWASIGNDAPTFIAGLGGGLRLTTSATGNERSIIAMNPLCRAQDGPLLFAVKLNLVTAITNKRIFIGLTDDGLTNEAPFSLDGSDVLTSNATDAVGFLYDSGASTDEWWLVGVNAGTDFTEVVASGIAPVADIDQWLCMSIDSDGTVRWYISAAGSDPQFALQLTAPKKLLNTVALTPTANLETLTTAIQLADLRLLNFDGEFAKE